MLSLNIGIISGSAWGTYTVWGSKWGHKHVKQTPNIVYYLNISKEKYKKEMLHDTTQI